MNLHLFRAAGFAGLLALAWVAGGTLRTHPLTVGMTLLMTGFYAMGVLELLRFQHHTAGLDRALQGLAPPPASAADLDRWLALVPDPLRTAVRLRVAGDRAALPGPALAPYLAGLLVLLGMLGTFVGMVVTLNGTGVALEQATSVQGMRDSLVAPVRGLGLAFGTSVAGVAASAMLGLMSALCRRDRQQVGQLLDQHTASTLQAFARSHLQQQQRQQEREGASRQHQQLQQQLHDASAQQRQQQHAALLATLAQAQQETQRWQQAQARQALDFQQQQERQFPQLADRLHALVAQLDAQTRATSQAQLEGQQQFLAGAQRAYTGLADTVGQTLQQHLQGSAASAAAGLQRAAQDIMAAISRETTALQTRVAADVQQLLQGFAQRFEAQADSWLGTAQAQAQQQAAALLQALEAGRARQLAQQGTHDEQRLAALTTLLAATATQQQHSASQLAAQTQAQVRAMLDDVARLVHTASQAPREAVTVMADVAAQLRDKLSDSLAHDNRLLQERSHIMDTLHTLLGAVQHTSTAQKAAIDQMVASTASWLQQAGARHTERVEAETARLEAVSAQLTSSAVDVASLGEALGTAVDLFSQANGQLVAHLQRLEAALAKSSARSDDQLAYYVAQAREVIDLSLLSQKQIVDDLQRLAGRAAAGPPGAVAAADAPALAPAADAPASVGTPVAA